MIFGVVVVVWDVVQEIQFELLYLELFLVVWDVVFPEFEF